MGDQVYNNIRTTLLKAQTAVKTRQPASIRAAQLKNDSSGPRGLPPPFLLPSGLERQTIGGQAAAMRIAPSRV